MYIRRLIFLQHWNSIGKYLRIIQRHIRDFSQFISIRLQVFDVKLSKDTSNKSSWNQTYWKIKIKKKKQEDLSKDKLFRAICRTCIAKRRSWRNINIYLTLYWLHAKGHSRPCRVTRPRGCGCIKHARSRKTARVRLSIKLSRLKASRQPRPLSGR